MNWPLIPLFIVCLVLSFVFSGMEAGVFALNRLRIRQLSRAGRASARALQRCLDQPENFLWTILVGNTLANLAIFGLAFTGLHRFAQGHVGGFIALFLVFVVLFYVLCDLLPKMLFRQYPNRLCVAVARPYRVLHQLLAPLVRSLEWVSRLLLRLTGGKTFSGELFGNRDELKVFMQESAQTFSSEERAMIGRVLELQSRTVGDVTKPLAQTATVELTTPLVEVVRLGRERGVTRLPVWGAREGLPRIVGVVNVDAVLFHGEPAPGGTVADFVKPAVYLGERMRLEEALRRLQRSGQRLAVVLARDGRELGILTLQDILQLIFGDLSL
jgi:CBS domain containing-hemolysin-like protein